MIWQWKLTECSCKPKQQSSSNLKKINKCLLGVKTCKRLNSPTIQLRLIQCKTTRTGILLLPSVSSVLCQITIPCDITTAVGKAYVASCIEDIRTERDKALRDTLLYRNIAEQLRREKRVLHNKLTGKCETIRDFWCNNLVEGCTRGGRWLERHCLGSIESDSSCHANLLVQVYKICCVHFFIPFVHEC